MTKPDAAPPPVHIAPARPAKPLMEQVVFEDKDGGLWLSYENYRALERNIISMREYEGKLEIALAFYEEAEDEGH